MVSPSLSCMNYTYKLFYKNSTLIEEGNLTLWANDDLYYFNFSENQGEYVIKLCDDTTREVRVMVSEEKMQAITWGFIILIIYYFVVGYFITNRHLKFGAFVFAFLELLMMIFFHFGSYQGGNLLPVLNVNFWVTMLIGFGLLMWKLFEHSVALMAIDKKKNKDQQGFEKSW